MHTTYRLNTSELDQTFLESLRAAFPGKEVEIMVYEIDETEYLLRSEPNRERLLASKANIERGENTVEISFQDLIEE